MHLRADEMVILLNQSSERCEVFAPLLGCQLLELDLAERRARVGGIIHMADYQDCLHDRRRKKSPGVAQEFPDYDIFQHAFRSSGLHKPTNWSSEIEPLLREAQESDPARGGAIYYFGFDNNVLRSRLYSLFLRVVSPRVPHYNYVLSRVLRDELNVRQDKMGGDFLHAFNKAVPNLSVPNVFTNQNRLADRLRLQGLCEFTAILGSGNCVMVRVPRKTPRSQLEADRQIIQSYATFAEQVGRRVVLLSADNEFVMQTGGLPNLTGQIVQYPVMLEEEMEGSWEEVGRLLYDLSVIFGCLELVLSAGTLRIYGVWDGKGEPHWRSEQTHITMPTQLGHVRRALKRNLTVLRELEQGRKGLEQ